MNTRFKKYLFVKTKQVGHKISQNYSYILGWTCFAWTVTIFSIILIFNWFPSIHFDSETRDEVQREETGEVTFELTDISVFGEFSRFFTSLSLEKFGILDFLSTHYWPIYITIFLSSIGALSVLLQVYDKVRPPEQADFSAAKRRNMAMLVTALAATNILGMATVLMSTRRRYLLDKLYTLEVQLIRFEGILFNAASRQVRPELAETLESYLGGYARRIRQFTDDVSKIYNFPNEEKLLERLYEFASGVLELAENRTIVTRPDQSNDDASAGTEDTDDTEHASSIEDDVVDGSEEYEVPASLSAILEDLESMRELVRRAIRQTEI